MATKPKTEEETIITDPYEDMSSYLGQAKSALDGTEPAALSSTLGSENFKTKILPGINSAMEAILAADKTRTENTKQDKEKKDTPTEIPPEVQAEMDSMADPVEKANKALYDSWDRQMDEAQRSAEELTLAATRSANAGISNLKGQWKERRQLLQESNRRNQESWKQQFIRTGQDEYSPGMTSDFISQKEGEGLAILKNLDVEYNNAVAALRFAADEKKYSTAADLSKTLRGIEEKALAQTLKNAEEAKATNDKLRENLTKASRENAIGNLIQKYGITDPAELQDFLNNDESGTQIDDVTLDEISKVLKIMGHDPSMSGLTSDYKTYSAMKKAGEISKDWTYTDFLAATSAAKRAPKSGSSIDTSTVTDPTGDLLSFDEFKFTPEAKALLQSETDSQVSQTGAGGFTTATAETFLRRIYNESATAYYRDNPSTSKKFTAGNIPTPLRENLVADINNNFTLAELIDAYPDISSSYISSTLNALKKKTKETEDTTSDEEFLNALKGS